MRAPEASRVTLTGPWAAEGGREHGRRLRGWSCATLGSRVEGMQEMGEMSVQVSFCDGGNLNGSIDESVEFVHLRVQSISMTR